MGFLQFRATDLRVCLFGILIFVFSGTFSAFAQPPNLGELKTQLLSYKLYGEYDRELAAVDTQAQAFIDAQASLWPKPAIVLDIDETSLSNWQEISADDFGYISAGSCTDLPKGPCGALAWDQLAQATAIEPTLALFNYAKAKGIAVFFITGRFEAERCATERNLQNAGYSGWAELIMRQTGKSSSVTDYKSGEREKIEQRGYTIIANIGDQPSDLNGGHSKGAFLLPNPFYRIP